MTVPATGRRWVLPADECVLLPVENTTAEWIARWIGVQLIDSRGTAACRSARLRAWRSTNASAAVGSVVGDVAPQPLPRSGVGDEQLARGVERERQPAAAERIRISPAPSGLLSTAPDRAEREPASVR